MTLISCAALLLVATSVQAIEGAMDIGKNYTNLTIGLGTNSPGFFLAGNWLRSNHDGNMSALALGYRIEAGGLTIAPSLRGMYIDPRHDKSGYASGLGVDASFAFDDMFGIYGNYYWSPESMANNVKSFHEIGGGFSFTPISLLKVRIGYQYLKLRSKSGSKDSVLSDGPYIGASLLL